MNAKVEKVDNNIVKLQLQIGAQEFETAMEKSFKKNAKYFNVPGFRKGKATRAIVERYYGEEVLYEDAVNFAFPEAYSQAIKETGIEPVDQPEINIVQIGKGKDLILEATVTVKPEVQLGEYKLLEVPKVDVVVTEDDVEKELQKIAEKNARVISVEDRPVQKGDTVVIDFEGFIDGEPFEGGKSENYTLEIGSGHFIEGFEDQLIGAQKGQEVEVNVTFPENYGNDKLNGKPATFKVKINEIKMKELPVIDDEFAKDISEFETLEEYKQDIRKKLVEEAEKNAKMQIEESVVNKAVENATVDIPEVMIENRINSIMNDIDMRLRYQGINIEKYCEIMGISQQEMREQYKERAEKDVKTQLVLEKIAKEEAIAPTDEEVQAEIAKLAERYKQPVEELRKHLNEDDIEYMRSNLAVSKTIDFLVENANIA